MILKEILSILRGFKRVHQKDFHIWGQTWSSCRKIPD